LSARRGSGSSIDSSRIGSDKMSSNTDSSSNAIIDKDKETLSLQLKNAELSLSDWIDRYNRRGDENDRLRQDIKVQGLYHHHYCIVTVVVDLVLVVV